MSFDGLFFHILDLACDTRPPVCMCFKYADFSVRFWSIGFWSSSMLFYFILCHCWWLKGGFWFNFIIERYTFLNSEFLFCFVQHMDLIIIIFFSVFILFLLPIGLITGQTTTTNKSSSSSVVANLNSNFEQQQLPYQNHNHQQQHSNHSISDHSIDSLCSNQNNIIDHKRQQKQQQQQQLRSSSSNRKHHRNRRSSTKTIIR